MIYHAVCKHVAMTPDKKYIYCVKDRFSNAKCTFISKRLLTLVEWEYMENNYKRFVSIINGEAIFSPPEDAPTCIIIMLMT
jgi:hypothetical protein